MITRRTKYALKALLVLGRGREGEPVQATEIAKEESIPLRFLQQILLELRRSGIVLSRKGKFGGYVLARSPDEISLLEVLRAIEGPLAPLPCLSRTAHEACPDCADAESCGVRVLLAGVHEATLSRAEATTLADGLSMAAARRRR